MEGLVMPDLPSDPCFWRNRTVFLTGHTGFKGGWLAHWLVSLGAKVHGYSLEPPTQPSFFVETALEKRLESSSTADIRDFHALLKEMRAANPEIVFHLAAQPLVRQSYLTPTETFDTNLMGTVNVLEAVRQIDSVRSVVLITTDKCYENREWIWPYRENDRLGGRDPYSASKACAELAISAYHHSFFSRSEVFVASARAGNVIGGGDWADDRLVPDFLRTIDAGRVLKIRSPNAVRPWQHVLEPLSGYMLLAERLFIDGESFSGGWNFGPSDEDAQPVSRVCESMCQKFPDASWQIEPGTHPHEAGLLKLDSTKARSALGWRPRWGLDIALQMTLDWHEAWRCGKNLSDVTDGQIAAYCRAQASETLESEA